MSFYVPTDAVDHMRVLAAQPYSQLRAFAELLEWRGLRLRHVNLHDGKLIVWYETTDLKFHLQINPEPPGQVTRYQATVIATRYGLALDAVGWHDFEVDGSDADLRQVAEHLPILRRSNFKNREWRKQFQRPYARRGQRSRR